VVADKDLLAGRRERLRPDTTCGYRADTLLAVSTMSNLSFLGPLLQIACPCLEESGIPPLISLDAMISFCVCCSFSQSLSAVRERLNLPYAGSSALHKVDR
jgi:hypothetical protein